MARRDAWRSKGRSLLVIALIGLPVFVMGAADIAYRTWQLDPTEKLSREIGTADVALRWSGGTVDQAPNAWLGDGGFSASFGGPLPPSPPPLATVRAALPKGSRLIERRDSATELQIKTTNGVATTAFTGLDYADPLAKGLVHQVSGRAPRTTGEIAITTSLASVTGLHVGDTMHLADGGRFTVVGTVHDANHRDSQTAYSVPGAVTVLDRFGSGLTWLASTPQPVTWSQVRQLNATGFLALSRSVYLHPPPKSQIPQAAQSSGGRISTQAIAVLTLIGGMALLEVVLLAGPAFAVSARRRRRDLALIAAVGGRRSDLRNTVLSGGVVLGVAAGVISALGAVLVTAIGIPLLGSHVDSIPGHYEVRPLEVGGLALLSVVTALLAAVFPARAAARTDVVAALAGRRGTVRTRTHVPVIGALVAGVGVLVALAGSGGAHGTEVILAGVVLVELGLIACAPTLIGAAARLGARLPLAPRIALRDAGRNRSSAAPAVAAVMASVIGAVSLTVGVASNQDQQRRSYQPILPMNSAYVPLSDPVQAAGVATAVRTALAPDATVVVRGPNLHCVDNGSGCASADVSVMAPVGSRTVSRYQPGILPDAIVDDGSALPTLVGRPEAAAVAALRAGSVVVFDSSAVRNGQVTLGVDDPKLSSPTRHSVPAVVVTDGDAPAGVVLPPSVAKALDISTAEVGVFARGNAAPSERQIQAATATLAGIDPILAINVETGYHNRDTWLMLALIAAAVAIAAAAAVIATALAKVDGRPDLITLGAVGASPRTRRVLSMSRAAVIAVLGTVIGVVAGFLAPGAWVMAVRREGPGVVTAAGHDVRLRLVVQWPMIALLLLGIPLVAAAVAGGFSRSRLPSERHAE